MLEEGRRRVWWLYGWFCAFMLCGSCCGAVTWAARMMDRGNLFKADDAFSRRDFVQAFSLYALSYSWSVVFFVTYAIEFLCLSAAKLMVLDRMSDFAAGQDEGTRKRWAAGGRMVMAVVVLGNAVGLAANVAAAVRIQKAAEAAKIASTMSANFAANSTQVALDSISLMQREAELAVSIAAVQSFCEVAVLLLIVAAFVVAGVVCARVVSSRLLAVDTESASAAAGTYLRRQMVVTTVVVFVAFVVRSVQSTMFAVARQLQDTATTCPGVTGVTGMCDASCYNVFTHMFLWMVHTPEFTVTVVLVSSPLALLVALWGMTTRLALQLMKSGKSDTEMATVRFRRDLLARQRGR